MPYDAAEEPAPDADAVTIETEHGGASQRDSRTPTSVVPDSSDPRLASWSRTTWARCPSMVRAIPSGSSRPS